MFEVELKDKGTVLEFPDSMLGADGSPLPEVSEIIQKQFYDEAPDQVEQKPILQEPKPEVAGPPSMRQEYEYGRTLRELATEGVKGLVSGAKEKLGEFFAGAESQGPPSMKMPLGTIGEGIPGISGQTIPREEIPKTLAMAEIFSRGVARTALPGLQTVTEKITGQPFIQLDKLPDTGYARGKRPDRYGLLPEHEVALAIGDTIGFVAGAPAGAMKLTMKGLWKVLPWIARIEKASPLAQRLIQIPLQAAGLSVGQTVAGIDSIIDGGVNQALEEVKGGGKFGAAFGAATAAFPQARLARIVGGLVALEASRGFNPEMPLYQRTYQTSLDVLFLWKNHGDRAINEMEQKLLPGMREATPEEAGKITLAESQAKQRALEAGARQEQPWSTTEQVKKFFEEHGQSGDPEEPWVPPDKRLPPPDSGGGPGAVAPTTFFGKVGQQSSEIREKLQEGADKALLAETGVQIKPEKPPTLPVAPVEVISPEKPPEAPAPPEVKAEAAPVEPEKTTPPRVTIPDFVALAKERGTSPTAEAERFGKRATPEEVAELNLQIKETQDLADRAKDAQDRQAWADAGNRVSVLKEALKVAPSAEAKVQGLFGIPPFATGFKKKLNNIVKLSRRNPAARIMFEDEYRGMTKEQRLELQNMGWTFDVDRQGRVLVGVSQEKKAEQLRQKVSGKAPPVAEVPKVEGKAKKGKWYKLFRPPEWVSEMPDKKNILGNLALAWRKPGVPQDFTLEHGRLSEAERKDLVRRGWTITEGKDGSILLGSDREAIAKVKSKPAPDVSRAKDAPPPGPDFKWSGIGSRHPEEGVVKIGHVDYPERLLDVVRRFREAVEGGEPGRRIFTEVSGQGGTPEITGPPSTYPNFMKDQGWTKDKVLRAMDLFMGGKELGVEQARIVDRMMEHALEEYERDADRTVRQQAEEEGIEPETLRDGIKELEKQSEEEVAREEGIDVEEVRAALTEEEFWAEAEKKFGLKLPEERQTVAGTPVFGEAPKQTTAGDLFGAEKGYTEETASLFGEGAKRGQIEWTPSDWMGKSVSKMTSSQLRDALTKIPTSKEGLAPDEWKFYVNRRREIQARLGGKLQAVQEELGQRVDEAVDRITEGGFLGRRPEPSERPTEGTQPFQFDETVEKRFQESKAVKPPGFWNQTKEMLTTFKNKILREYEHLPKTGEFAQLRFDLLNLSKGKAIASGNAVKSIQGYLSGLSKSEFDLFSRKVMLDDLQETVLDQIAKERDIKLPWALTEESLSRNAAELEKVIKGNPKILEALDLRKKLWDALKSNYSEAMDSIGRDVEKKLTKEKYWRHQVIDYIRMKVVFGTGQRLRSPSYRSFLKERKGSELDILSDLVVTEQEVMAQMLYDIQVAKVIRLVDRQYNIGRTLKQKAKDQNFETLVGGPEIVKRILKLEGKIAEIRSGEHLDSGDRKELKLLADELNELDPTRIFKQKMAIGFSKLQRAGVDVDDFSVLSELAKETSDLGMAASTVFKAIHEKEAMIKETLGDQYLENRHYVDERLIPEGYTEWQPDEGNVFYMANTIPEALAQKLATGQLEGLGVSPKDIRKVLAMGGKKRQFIVKNEVADTLNNITRTVQHNMISGPHRAMIRSWKIWQLVSPRRFPKYNTRNLTGDSDAVFAGNPRVFLKTPRAVQELWPVFFKKKTATGDLKDFLNRGGATGTLQAMEMGQIDALPIFDRLLERGRGKLTDIPKNLWKGYWKTVRMATDFRETILRYAAYLDYTEQMRASPTGKPKNFGASIPEEIMGLKDTKDRAYWLSNDLLGAYDRVGVFGQTLREHLYPFWSWKEVNMRRYIQIFKNASEDHTLASAVGRSLGAKSAFFAYNTGKVMIRISAFWGLLQVWNNLKYPNEEKELPEQIRATPHIITGRDKDGKILYFSRLGAFSDLLSNFGIDAAPRYINQLFQGRMTAKEIATEMGKAPANVLIQGGEPFVRMGYEVLMRRSLFPDAFKPGVVRDRMYHTMKSIGLENEYKAIAGLPSHPYSQSIPDMFIYRSDPLESAYGDVLNMRWKFMKKLGKAGEGFWLSDRGNALYNAKLALRYKDRRAFQRYVKDYANFGGTREGIEDSFKSMLPLYGLTLPEQIAFVKSLSETEKETLAKANLFYTQLVTASMGD